MNSGKVKIVQVVWGGVITNFAAEKQVNKKMILLNISEIIQ